MKSDFRVFISYRGGTEGKVFANDLYNYLIKDPLHERRYGKIYFSPETLPFGGNFKKEVPDIMQSVKFFVMPLTKDYFKDFWDEDKQCANQDSITYLEVSEALQNNSKFICIKFPEFAFDKKTIKKIFPETADDILCVSTKDYNENNKEKMFDEISKILQIDAYQGCGISQKLNELVPNVYISTKGNLEASDKYPFYEKLRDVKKITLLNYASSSFITGIDIASTYEESDVLKKWFDSNLTSGKIEANVILTNPHSYAAYDASMFKMYPAGLTMDKKDIIVRNLNKLFAFINKYPKAKLSVYLTDIALPYGVMISEHENKANNHIKVDVYSPVITDDKNRPSFYLLQENESTASIYTFFEGNVKNIMNNYSFKYNGHFKIEWLLDKNIIHRGVIKEGICSHTRGAYDACIAANYPVEVDLLSLSDGTIVVGRSEECITLNGQTKKLSECTIRDLRKYNQTAGDKQVFTFDSFLDYINNRIPVLIEIKNNIINGKPVLNDDEKKAYVKNILSIVKKDVCLLLHKKVILTVSLLIELHFTQRIHLF